MDLISSINTNSHIPYYIQLMDLLKEMIQQKKWAPGEQIPCEKELCESYNISRTVVRQALRELELDGIITRIKGKGTYVTKPKINEGLVQKLTGFYQDMVERGLHPSTKVLHQNVIPANEKVARYLKIKPETEVIDVERLRFINNEPIQLVTTYIPYFIYPPLATVDLTFRSLYEYLEKEGGIILTHGHRYIEAVKANAREAQLLCIKRGEPLLMLDSVTYDADSLPIEYYHAVHRGDRSRFEVDLVREL